MLKVLHFADAHIDIANHGRHDPDTALPIRVMDFLKALDQIVETAVSQEVDLVIFAGDAYKDRNPQPTFQREWGRRMMRLSAAGIPTVLLIGNHDMSPASGRAHTLHEFRTLEVPHIHVADRLERLDPDRLGVAAQIIAVPWVSQSRLMTREQTAGKSQEDVALMMENMVAKRIDQLMETADSDLPLILTAHASVQGAVYGSERAVMLGSELVLSGNIVNDGRLDYVALGHIHKHQDLSKGGQPPVVYPGSIERVDFGEINERKGFVMLELEKGNANWEFIPLETRRFLDIPIDTGSADSFMEDILRQLPSPARVADAVCRVKLSYPRDWEPLLDEKTIYNHFSEALSVQIQKHRHTEKRARLGDTAVVESLNPIELLEKYWQSIELDGEETAVMQTLAKETLGQSFDEA